MRIIPPGFQCLLFIFNIGISQIFIYAQLKQRNSSKPTNWNSRFTPLSPETNMVMF